MTTPETGADGSGHMLHNLMLFGEVLRRAGLDFGSANMLDLVRATQDVPLGRKQDFYFAARSLLVHRKPDLPLFDEAFRVFWRKPAQGETTMDLRSMGEKRRYRKPQVSPPRGADDDDGSGSSGQEQPTVDMARTYSAQEVLREKDFSTFTAGELAAARQVLAQLAWEPGRRRTRRKVPGAGAQPDLRRTLRRNLKYGGELLEISHRQPRDRVRPLVLLCDVSGSMERYTRMLLHFIHTMAGGLGSVEAFLFATRLTRITRHLRYRSVDQAVSAVSRAVPDWAGGTRIGDVLKTFNYQWARRVMRSGSVVLVISDGWDRGEPDLLSKELARLQRSCHRVIWLNPLLGSPSYQPMTQGMQAALPYVDDFMPVHNLNSLESLARHLSALTPQRPLPGRYHPLRPGTGEDTPEAAPTPSPTSMRRGFNPALASSFGYQRWGHGNNA